MKIDIQLPKNIIKSLREGPLGKYINEFIFFLDKKGFSKKYIPRRLGLIDDLGKWIITKKINIKMLDKKIVDKFINQKKIVLLLWMGVFTGLH